MTETTKQRTDRLLGMSRGELVLHAQDLTYQRDELLAALKEAHEFMEYCWRDVQMSYYAFERLETAMEQSRALIARMEEGK